MKRRLIILFASLAALTAGLAPVSFAIWFAYTTTVGNAEAQVARYCRDDCR